MFIEGSDEMTFTEAELAIADIKEDDDSLKKSPEEIDKMYSDIIGESQGARIDLKTEIEANATMFFDNYSPKEKIARITDRLNQEYSRLFGSGSLNSRGIDFQLGVLLNDRFPKGQVRDEINSKLIEKALDLLGRENASKENFDLLEDSNISSDLKYKLLAIYIVDKYFEGDVSNFDVQNFIQGKLTLPMLQTQGEFAAKAREVRTA